MGAQKFGMCFETQGNQIFWRDIPGFCRDIPGAPEKQAHCCMVCVQFSFPIIAVNSQLAKMMLPNEPCQLQIFLEIPSEKLSIEITRDFVRAKNREETKGQDKFDHDKGQKSAISGRRLHWRLSTRFCAFSPVFICNLVDEPPKIWRK